MSTELQKQQSPAATLKGLIGSQHFKDQLAASLPTHLSPDRFARIAITALTRTPKLLECTQPSLFKCLLELSALGLEPDGRNAHLIPYGKDCTLIIDWKGLVALAKRSGDVQSWSAQDVCENDQFRWQDGVVYHEIDWRNDRGKAQCYYSRVTLKDGSLEFEVMTLAEVEAIRKRSKAGNSGPWVSDFNEMAKKTVMRRHSKRLTLSPEFHNALEKDGDKFEEIRKERVVTPARTEPIDPFATGPILPAAELENAPEQSWGDEGKEGGAE